MQLHFSKKEYAGRLAKCREAMAARGLDAMLLFKQESMYYLTGYDTSGYLYFQTLLVGADGTLSLLTRSGDLASARRTSIIEDVRIWIDRAGANPGNDIRAMLKDAGHAATRIGVELEAVGLSARRGKWVEGALEGLCKWEDATDIIDGLRQVKSAAELVYVRKSAEISQATFETAKEYSIPDTPLGHVRAAMLATAVERGGDPPGVRWILGCGEGALVVRYFTGSGDQRIGNNDQITHEFGVPYRHYYTALMATLLTGKVDPRHERMFEACREALSASKNRVCPGHIFGDIYAAHAETLTVAGFEGQFLNTCGYPLGATYPPTWVEQPIIYRDNPLVLRPGMVLFLHMILQDTDRSLAMSLGETVLVTDKGCEALTHAPDKLVVN